MSTWRGLRKRSFTLPDDGDSSHSSDRGPAGLTYSPLLPVALAFAGGIATAPYFHLRAHEQLAVLIASVLLASLLSFKKKLWPALLGAWIGVFVGGAFLASFERINPPPNHIESLSRNGSINPGQQVKIHGWALTPSQARPGTYVIDLAVEQIEQNELLFPTSGAIRVYYYPRNQEEPPLRLDYGSRVAISLRDLRAPRNFGNPGSFDYAGSMRRQGISFTALLRNRKTDLQVLPGQAGSRWRGVVFRAREGSLKAIERLFAGQPVKQSILKAMLLGDDSWLDPRTERAFQESGTYHVLVISGWNVAVFAVPLLLLLIRLCLPNWLSSLIVFGSVASFALLAQSEIPIVRASLMFLVYLIARLFFRRRALINSLAATALLLLILHPSDLWDWGFQLSFLAVLTLAAIALPAVEWTISPLRSALRELFDENGDSRFTPTQAQFRMDLRTLIDYLVVPSRESSRLQRGIRETLRSSAWMVISLAEALLFTATMQAGYALVTALYFHRLTWSGVLANLLILPTASCIVMLGIILVPLVYLAPPLAQLLAPLLGWTIAALTTTTELAAELTALNSRVATPPFWLSLVFLLTTVSLAALIALRSKWSGATAALLIACCVALTWMRPGTSCASGQLEVTSIDVGQGDALLVCFPQGTTMLIDAGGSIPIPGSPVRRQDIGETVVSSYLWNRGITRLDYVVLSHDHFDHMGGLEAIFENFSLGEFWMGPDAADRKMDRLRNLARAAGAQIIWPVTSQTENSARKIDGVQVEVLSPPPDWAPRKVSNDDSIVLRLAMGQRSILLAGDIESRMEQLLTGSGKQLASDVLKVAHHGSRTSTTPEFLAQVNPGFAFMSVGAFGRFGHPSPQVIEALSAAGIPVYSTAKQGALSIRTDGWRIQIDTHRDKFHDWPQFLP